MKDVTITPFLWIQLQNVLTLLRLVFPEITDWERVWNDTLTVSALVESSRSGG